MKMKALVLTGALLLAICGLVNAVYYWDLPGILDERKKTAQVKRDLKMLEAEVAAYYNKTKGKYPSFDPPKMEGEVLVDPWGRYYVLDLNSRHPQTDMPLIFSQGPEPGKSQIIANWD